MSISGFEDAGLTTSDVLAAMTELERNTSESIRASRAHDRLSMKMKVIGQPGNMSQRHEFRVQGVTGDVSKGGCCVLFPVPLMVGDIYVLSFDRKVLNVTPVMARCLRCRLLRDDAFECGFGFFAELDLKAVANDESDDLFA